MTHGIPVIGVVDDSLTIRKILEVCLHRAGYQVRTCADAVEVFEWLRTPGVQIPAFIFVDVGLPRMDGYTLTQRLRTRAAFAQTTVVMISARCGVLDRLKARLAGANLYLTKPLRTQTILSVVQEYLGPSLSKDGDSGHEQEVERMAFSGGRR